MAWYYEHLTMQQVVAQTTCIRDMSSPNTASSLHGLVSARAAAAPAAVAIECQGRQLTYAELERRSNRLARVLQAQGVGRGVLVGVQAERSLDMVVSLLATLKAGGAYVPVDPAHGTARVSTILAEAQPHIVLGDPGFFQALTTAPCINPSAALPPEIAGSPVDFGVLPSDLAYVLFTSGSTGRPKGVEIEHRSLLNFFQSMLSEPGFTASDTLLAVTTLAFDIAGLELYLPLIAGGRVVIAGADVVADGRALSELIRSSNASVMQATPATWRLLFASGWQGSEKLKVLVGGEALSPELGRQLVRSCREVWNLYGPTETTIWSSLYRVTGKEERLVPIGRPIAQTALHILDENLRPVTSGEEGELYIGGEGLARGYLRRPELTAARFLPDPFSSQPAARLYRTGDVARLAASGNVEFLGRTDHQVKIRGFRIELGEIESVLERCPGVRQAVAMALGDTGPDDHRDKYIVAYVVLDTARPASNAELRACAEASLPGYMLPTAYVVLARFPLTGNGKVNRNALPAPAASDFSRGRPYVAPRNPAERKLAQLWQAILHISKVSVTASFFELGGRSLQAAQLFVKIGRTFDVDLPVSTLFSAPSIEQLAQVLAAQVAHQRDANPAYRTLIPIQPNGSKPPFFCVHGGLGSTLFLHQLAGKLPPDQPFYGIEPEGLDGAPFHRATIEQMASHYVAALRGVQPKPPYQLGGYCFGGIVAVEMAQQLRRQGEEVSIVALFSAPLRYHRLHPASPPLSRSAAARVKRLVRSPHELLMRRWNRFKSAALLNICRLPLALGRPVPQTLRSHYVDQMLRRAEWQYVPAFYPGALHLFRGSGLYDHDPSMGWAGLAENLYDYVIGAEATRLRRDIMDEPLVGLLANELAEALDSARGSLQGVKTEESEEAFL